MDASMLPSAVVDSDLKPEVDEKDAHHMAATAMTSFIGGLVGDERARIQINSLVEDTAELLQPLLDGMLLEGSYDVKEPCYGHELVNPVLPTCLQGSKWTEYAQGIMGGDIADKNATLITEDNFHRVYTVTPVHLPQVNNSCDGTTACTL